MKNYIKIGTPATYHLNGEKFPFEIIEIYNKRKILLREMKSTPTSSCDLPYGTQDYTYESLPGGFTLVATKRKDGYFRPLLFGVVNAKTNYFTFGKFELYRDPYKK